LSDSGAHQAATEHANFFDFHQTELPSSDLLRDKRHHISPKTTMSLAIQIYLRSYIPYEVPSRVNFAGITTFAIRAQDDLGLNFCYKFLTNVRHSTDTFFAPRTYSHPGPGALESSRDRFPSLHRRRPGLDTLPGGGCGRARAFCLHPPARNQTTHNFMSQVANLLCSAGLQAGNL
jgi:hypothetical protein